MIKISISRTIHSEKKIVSFFTGPIAYVRRDSPFTVQTEVWARGVKKGKCDGSFQFLTVALEVLCKNFSPSQERIKCYIDFVAF